MPKKAYVMRGLPGCGKSTLAKTFIPATICSADDHYIKNGKYVFDPAELGNAHAACLKKFTEAVIRGDDVVICDNTNLSPVDAAPYMALAQAYGYETKLITVNIDEVTSATRNVHGVPEAHIKNMARFMKLNDKNIPKRWVHEIRDGK
jgi:predicted kinase